MLNESNKLINAKGRGTGNKPTLWKQLSYEIWFSSKSCLLPSQLQPCLADSQGLQAVQWKCNWRNEAKAHSCTWQIFSEEWLEKGSLLSAEHFLAGTTSSWYLCGKLWLIDVMFSILWESKLVFESIWMTTYISFFFFRCLYCTCFYSENNFESL